MKFSKEQKEFIKSKIDQVLVYDDHGKTLVNLLKENKELKKELGLNEELEVGKWYKSHNGTGLLLFTGKVTYGFWNGNWRDSLLFSGKGPYEHTLATDKEVEKALIAEAKRRGFKKGVKFKTPSGNEILMKNTPYWNGVQFLNSDGYGEIFRGGKWAEIIEEVPEYTMDEAIEKMGHEFKIKN